MAIPVSIFHPPALIQTGIQAQEERFERSAMGSRLNYLRARARTALEKALRVKPRVVRLLFLDAPIKRRYYAVRGKSGEYVVLLFEDKDGRWFVACSCPSGNPPRKRGVIAWHPKPCYHAAAVLLESVKTVSATEARERRRKTK